MRSSPDVGYNADPNTGVAVYDSVPDSGFSGWDVVGGTSAGSPQWAGLTAITDQMAGGRVGNINKSLYKLGKKSQGTYFHDVTTGNNTFTGTNADGNPTTVQGFSAGPGFDEATGWGTPIAGTLLPAIAKPGNG